MEQQEMAGNIHLLPWWGRLMDAPSRDRIEDQRMDAATITVVGTVVGLAIAQAGVVVTVMITLHGQTIDAITALSTRIDVLSTRV